MSYRHSSYRKFKKLMARHEADPEGWATQGSGVDSFTENQWDRFYLFPWNPLRKKSK